jgi:hypothetical protein
MLISVSAAPADTSHAIQSEWSQLHHCITHAMKMCPSWHYVDSAAAHRAGILLYVTQSPKAGQNRQNM